MTIFGPMLGSTGYSLELSNGEACSPDKRTFIPQLE